MSKTLRIIIAGGKTGGHLFPGIAIAQALERVLEKTDKRAETLFVGTRAMFEIQTLEKYGYAHKAIYSKPVKGGNIFDKIFAASVILISLIHSLIIMRTFKPNFVMGVGGFPSFAVIMAAWMFRIPTAIQEQNAYPGMTNSILSKFTNTIFTSFKDTKGFGSNPKVKYVGNPVRRTTNRQTGYPLNLDSYDPDRFTLLVTGGSQGAVSINNAFMDALELMERPEERFNIIHQTGISEETFIKEKYKHLKISANARAFFHDMPEVQKVSDIVITRAGAGIIAEICTQGLPAILIPFPYAADDHQTINAKTLEKEGGAIMLHERDLTGEVLKKKIEALVHSKERLKSMGRGLKGLAMPDADEKIAFHILNVTG